MRLFNWSFRSLLLNISKRARPRVIETGGSSVRSLSQTCRRASPGGIVPKPLNAEQVNELVELLREPPAGEESVLLDLLTERVPAGVDEAAYVKAAYLAAIAKGEASSPLIDSRRATELLGTMLGGYNIQPLIDLLDSDDVADAAADALSSTLLMFDAFHDVVEKAASNPHAERVLNAWANAEWFTNRPPQLIPSPSLFLWLREKPTPMTYPLRVTRGADQTSLYTRSRCSAKRWTMRLARSKP